MSKIRHFDVINHIEICKQTKTTTTKKNLNFVHRNLFMRLMNYKHKCI